MALSPRAVADEREESFYRPGFVWRSWYDSRYEWCYLVDCSHEVMVALLIRLPALHHGHRHRPPCFPGKMTVHLWRDSSLLPLMRRCTNPFHRQRQ